MSRPGWRFLPVPALAACLGLGLLVGAGLPLAGFLASHWNVKILIGDAWAAEAFLSVADDIPLMYGLTDKTDAAPGFDNPAGRTPPTQARGPVPIPAERGICA